MTKTPPGLNRISQWLHQRQQQVLSNALSDAQAIKRLEDQYYGGQKIAQAPAQSKTVYDYVRSLRDRKLLQIRTNLTQFRLNSFLLNPSPTDADSPGVESQEVLAKLDFIEAVIGKYRNSLEEDLAQATAQMQENDLHPSKSSLWPPIGGEKPTESESEPIPMPEQGLDSAPMSASADSPKRHPMGFFGGSLMGINLAPNYEQRVVQELRLHRLENRMALRWLAILVLVPLLLALLSRNLIFEPLLGNYSDKHPTQIELGKEIQEEFALQLSHFKEKLEIQELLGLTGEMSPETKQKAVSAKAAELWREAREKELSSLKNILADGVALGVFAGLVFFNRSRLAVVRTATNRTFLGLGDPVKVFIFILVSDIFVGFHSSEGWTVILRGIGHHYGLPENEAAIGLFIATVPVIVDACIKFWIFAYLTRFSPSSSAIYERMNT